MEVPEKVLKAANKVLKKHKSEVVLPDMDKYESMSLKASIT